LPYPLDASTDAASILHDCAIVGTLAMEPRAFEVSAAGLPVRWLAHRFGALLMTASSISALPLARGAA